MSPIEIIAFLLGLANVVLLIRRSIWNYPFGIAMVALYFMIFWDAKLYSDAALQIFFIVVQGYGWWAWSRGWRSGVVDVRTMDASARLGWGVATALLTALWGTAMHRYTDASLPYWDASIAMMSVAAQVLMTRRFVENWAWWVAVDAVSIGVYAAKGLWLTMVLYVIFLVLAAAGWIAWRRQARAVST
jgi:nicotinamide mononucleotide transporter